MHILRKIGQIVGAGVFLGFLMLALQKFYGWSNGQMLQYYKISALVIIGLNVLVVILSQVLYLRKITKTGHLLQEGRIDEFIGENEAILEKTKNPMKQALVKLNLTAGYCDKSQYKKALATLESIGLKTLSGPYKPLYYNNLAFVYFKLGQDEKGLHVLSQYSDVLKQGEKGPLAPFIYQTNIMAQIAQGDLDTAREMVAVLLQSNQDPRIRKDTLELAEKLNMDISNEQ